MKIITIKYIFTKRFVYEFLNEFLYKCYILIELTFLKELTLIKQANQKSAIFVTVGIFT